MQALLAILLNDLVAAESATLKQIMDEVCRKPRTRGLKPDLLNSLNIST